jgi:peroxiredoxin
MLLRAATRATRPALAAHSRSMAIAVGSKFPSVQVDKASWPPTSFDLAEHIANKKVILVGLPGAFTPT